MPEGGKGLLRQEMSNSSKAAQCSRATIWEAATEARALAPEIQCDCVSQHYASYGAHLGKRETALMCRDERPGQSENTLRDGCEVDVVFGVVHADDLRLAIGEELFGLCLSERCHGEVPSLSWTPSVR